VAAKNSTANNTYAFNDAKPLAGVSYYRLKMTDKDGAVKYTAIVTVNNKSAVAVNIYPNPVTTEINVQHGKGEAAVIRILDMGGKQVMAVNVSENAIQTTINAARLAPGTYMVVFENNGVKSTKQFVKQ